MAEKKDEEMDVVDVTELTAASDLGPQLVEVMKKVQKRCSLYVRFTILMFESLWTTRNLAVGILIGFYEVGTQ